MIDEQLNNEHLGELKKYQEIVSEADGVLCFIGGEGGSVKFDGSGAPLVKHCAPVNMIIYIGLRRNHSPKISLKIDGGMMNHLTGSAANVVERGPFKEMYVAGNTDLSGLQITGAIPSLGLYGGSVLFTSSLGAAYTQFHQPDEFGMTQIPHWGSNNDVIVHKAILDCFDVELPEPSGGYHKWDKPTPDPKREHSESFVTSQGIAAIEVPVKRRI